MNETTEELETAAPPEPEQAPHILPEEKVALLLVTLGEEAAGAVLKRLDNTNGLKDRVLRLMAEHRSLPMEASSEILEEYLAFMRGAELVAEGGLDFAYNALKISDGPSSAEETIRRLKRDMSDGGLARLRKADPENLRLLIQAQHPQIGAVILAHMEPPVAAQIIADLNEEFRIDIMFRMSMVERVKPEMTDILERSLGDEALALSQNQSQVGGAKVVAEILNNTPGSMEKGILESISARREDLASEIKNLMFVFEDLMNLDERSLGTICSEVDTTVLSNALRGAKNEELQEKILGSLTKRQGKALIDEMEMAAPIRISDAEEAQTQVIQMVRRLEESGDIVLNTGDDVLV